MPSNRTRLVAGAVQRCLIRQMFVIEQLGVACVVNAMLQRGVIDVVRDKGVRRPRGKRLIALAMLASASAGNTRCHTSLPINLRDGFQLEPAIASF